MSDQFTISTVPLPNPCGRPSRYPYRQLAVGESASGRSGKAVRGSAPHPATSRPATTCLTGSTCLPSLPSCLRMMLALSQPTRDDQPGWRARCARSSALTCSGT